MNTVIWTTFFTAAGAVGAALVTAVFANRSQARVTEQASRQAEETRRQAEQASAAAVAAAVLDRQRDANAKLLGTARYWLIAAQEIQQEFFAGLPKDLQVDRSGGVQDPV
jgi:hypothetical protein